MVTQTRQPTKIEEDLQREYAAQLLALRGYTGNPRTAPVPADSSVGITPTEIIEGDTRSLVRVTSSFDTPPIAAFVDGKYPLGLHVTRDSRGQSVVSLPVPKGTSRSRGPVSLVFLDRTIVLDQPLTIKRRSLVETIEFSTDEATPGELYLRMNFPEEPLEVHFGGREISPDNYTWRRDTLIVRVPDDCPSGPLLVLTNRRVYQSPQPYMPPNDTNYGAMASENA